MLAFQTLMPVYTRGVYITKKLKNICPYNDVFVAKKTLAETVVYTHKDY